jgi:GTPase SAR1 family protein
MNLVSGQRFTGFVMPVGNGAVGKTTLAHALDCISRGEMISLDRLRKIRKTNNLEFEYINSREMYGNTEFSVTLQFLVPPGQKQVESDTTGRSFEQVVEIFRTSIRRLDVVLFTYSLSDHGSFQDLAYWVDGVTMLLNDETDFILLGTHLDQRDDVQITPPEIAAGIDYLRQQILIAHPTWTGKSTQLEVSCTSGENLNTLLRYLAFSIARTSK